MSNLTTHARQSVLSLVQYFDFSDTQVDTSAVQLKLPPGAVILRGSILVETIWNGTTPTLSVGIAGATTKYGSALSLGSAANVALTGTPAREASGATILLTANAGAKASTAGKARLMMEYIVEDRATEVQPS